MAPAVVAVAYDGLCTFEYGIVVEVFALPRPELDVDWYTYSVASADPGPLHAAGGLVITVDSDLGALETADIVVIPGWRDPAAIPPAELLDAICSAHTRGARLVTICSGVFVLAAAGVLEGRPAATHWRYADHLRTTYPGIDVRPDVLYVDAGDILTSAGSAAGIDLCLHIVRSDYGAHVAASVARRLVTNPHRDGGQAQFIPEPVRLEDDRSTLAAAMDWATAHLEQPITVAQLAERARMSERTLLRRFQATVGVTPHRWLTRQRLHRAQDLLESTNHSIELVAHKSGFGSIESLRLHFRRALQTSPSTYRRTFVRH